MRALSRPMESRRQVRPFREDCGGGGSEVCRAFVGASSHKITTAIGALNFAFGPGTAVLVIRTPASFAAVNILAVGATGVGFSVNLTSGGVLQLRTDATAVSGVSALSASTAYLVAVTKATGAVAPRMHFVNLSTGAATHENSASTLANASTAATRAAFGVNAAGTGAFYTGDIAAAAVWNTVLTDAQITALSFGSFANWIAAGGLKALWQLNQLNDLAALKDLTGNGADQTAITGTSVSANRIPLR